MIEGEVRVLLVAPGHERTRGWLNRGETKDHPLHLSIMTHMSTMTLHCNKKNVSQMIYRGSIFLIWQRWLIDVLVRSSQPEQTLEVPIVSSSLRPFDLVITNIIGQWLATIMAFDSEGHQLLNQSSITPAASL
jgi:hypothetical protein